MTITVVIIDDFGCREVINDSAARKGVTSRDFSAAGVNVRILVVLRECLE